MAERIVPAAIAAVLLAGAVTAAPERNTRAIDLAFVPQESVAAPRPVLAGGMTEGAVRVTVQDARGLTDPRQVGVQIDEGRERYAWIAGQDVPATVGRFVEEVLRGWSMRLDPAAERELALELTRYQVTETDQAVGSTYAADVAFRATLRRGGQQVWAGSASGEARRYGRGESAANSNEVLSDALKNTLAGLLNHGGLQSAWARDDAPVATAPAAADLDPAAMLRELLRLRAAGSGTEVLVAFVRQRRMSAPLSADDVLAWKQAGLPEEVVTAALQASAPPR